MSMIPSNLARVPNMLISSVQLQNITRTNVEYLKVQAELSTGRVVNRPSDDAAAAAAIGVLDNEIERSDQRQRNIQHAQSVLDFTDATLGELSEMFLQAQGVASSMIQADGQTREAQAVVVDSLINEMVSVANSEYLGIYLFGGSRTASEPILSDVGGLRYAGEGTGLITDLGNGLRIPITTTAEDVFGSLSARVRGQRELEPSVTEETKLSDLNGARGVGVTPGLIEFSLDGGPHVPIDLSEADNVGDVMDMINAAIAQYETDNGLAVFEAGRISLTGEQITMDMAGGGTGPTPVLEFHDVNPGKTASDLGLAQTVFQSGVNEVGSELNPRVTWQTEIAAVPGLASPLGSIRITNGMQSQIVDLSSAETLQDVRNAIEATELGVRVAISESGTGLDILNEWSGATMSITEVDDGFGQTAELLGIRTLVGSTALVDYNHGRGVEIVHGNVDPSTGLPDPARDVDFTITLADGSSFDVNLQPEDVTTRDVIDRINQAATDAETAGTIPAGAFLAALAVDSNGIAFTDGTGGADQLRIEKQNGSFAAQDLGLIDGTWDAASATFTGSDRTSVRVDSAFSTLMDLRDALERNDTRGITFAGEHLTEDIQRAAKARAEMGGRAQRVRVAAQREEERQTQSISVRSTLRDLDYTEASIRFSLLQSQLQAGLTTTSLGTSLNLLNFIG
jgi:flagellin-like hook-associated protein FlgL